MNVIVISSSAPLGTGESFVVDEVNALAKKGLKVSLFPTVLRKGNPNRFSFHENVRVVLCPIFSPLAVWSVLRLALSNTKLLARLVKLTFSSGVGSSLKNIVVLPKSILIAEYARKHGVEHIHAHWLTASATLAMMVSAQTEIPWSVTAHRGDIVSSNALQKKFDTATFVRFISCSGVALARSRARIDEDKVKILHMGVELPPGKPGANTLRDSPVLKVLCPANLLPVKGHSILLMALSRMECRDLIRVELAGDGKLRQSLEQMVKQLGLGNTVVFRGHVPHEDLIGAYRNGEIDIVVLPSLDLGNGEHEGIPVSLMEAMSWGVPVVSTLTGGIPEIVVDPTGAKVGVLVDAGDSLALSGALDRLVESPGLRASLGAMGRKRVVDDFNQDLIVSELVGLMRSSTLESRGGEASGARDNG